MFDDSSSESNTSYEKFTAVTNLNLMSLNWAHSDVTQCYKVKQLLISIAIPAFNK